MDSKKTAKCFVWMILLSLCLPVLAQDRSRVVQQQSTNNANPVTLSLKATLGSHKNQVDAVDFSPDGQFLVTGSYKDKAKLWNIATGQLIAALDGSISLRRAGYDQSLDVFSPDSHLLITTRGNDASLWDTATGRLRFNLTGHEGNITAASFNMSGDRLATGSADGTVRLWNAATGKLINSLRVIKKLPKYRIISRALSLPIDIEVSFSPDGHQILAVAIGEVSPAKLWNAETGQLLSTFEHTRMTNFQVEAAQIYNASFSPDGNFILTGSLEESKLWDAQTGVLRAAFENLSGTTSFNSDGRFLGLIKYKSKTGLLNVKTLTMQAEFGVDTSFLNQMAFSPDNQTLVFASGYKKYQATLIDIPGGSVKARVPLLSKLGTDFISPEYQKDSDLISFHPNSRMLMGVNHQSVRFWDALTGQLITETTEGRDPAAISPDGKLLVTAGKDKKSVLIWEIKGV